MLATFSTILFEIGANYLTEKPEYAEPFLLKSLDIQRKHFNSLTHIALCPVIHNLSSLYFKLGNYSLAQFYAKKSLIISYEQNDWKHDVNAVSDALILYFDASNEIGNHDAVRLAYVAIVNYKKSVEKAFPNGLPFALSCKRYVDHYRSDPAFQNLDYTHTPFEQFPSVAGTNPFKEDCHYAKEKMVQLSKASSVTIHERVGFFSPSRYSSTQHVYGPYRDYCCSSGDKITDLSLLVTRFS